MITKEDVEREIEREIQQYEFETALEYAIEFTEKYCGIKLNAGDEIEEKSFSSPTSFIEVKNKPLVSLYIEDCIFELGDLVLPKEEAYINQYYWGIFIEPAITYCKIKYRYGYERIPYPLEKAILKMCVMFLVKLDKPIANVESLSSGGVTMRFELANLEEKKPTGNDFVDSILNMYRLRRPLLY